MNEIKHDIGLSISPEILSNLLNRIAALEAENSTALNVIDRLESENASLRDRKPLTDCEVHEYHGDSTRGFCIEEEHYFKAFRDAERAHGIGGGNGD